MGYFSSQREVCFDLGDLKHNRAVAAVLQVYNPEDVS
jgi:hypothetical protein